MRVVDHELDGKKVWADQDLNAVVVRVMSGEIVTVAQADDAQDVIDEIYANFGAAAQHSESLDETTNTWAFDVYLI
jgi:hypothetical protein